MERCWNKNTKAVPDKCNTFADVKKVIKNTARALYEGVALPFYRRYALKKMQQTDTYELEGIRVTIPPGVFHPGVLLSTPFFIKFLKSVPFQGKKVIDIGSGSGLLALFAASKGAIVTAIDINPQSVETTRMNAVHNHLSLSALESNLFENIGADAKFDLVLINPPYFQKKPANIAEHAFFAGAEFEYFQELFSQLPSYTHRQSCIYLVFSAECNMEAIERIAHKNNGYLHTCFQERRWGKRLFVTELKYREA